MASRVVMLGAMLLLASACVPAVHAPAIVSVGPTRIEPFLEVASQITQLMSVCDGDQWLRVEPVGASAFKLRCIAGQFQVEVPVCDGWDMEFEKRVVQATKSRRFDYGINIPEVGCQAFVMHTNDAGRDLAERTLALVGSVLRVSSAAITSVTSETYASAR